MISAFGPPSRYVRPMATFTVFLMTGGDFQFTDDAGYTVLDSGALEVLDPANTRHIVFGPAAWQRLEESSKDAHFDVMDRPGRRVRR